MIADQPHMLAYINQDEEALLRSFGGSGIAGPGGIPSYPPGTTGYGSGEGTGYGSSISATRDRLKDMAKSDDDDDYTPTSAELAAQLEAKGLTNITPGPLSVEDQVAQYKLLEMITLLKYQFCLVGLVMKILKAVITKGL